MSRFIDYLKGILSPEQYAQFQEQKRLDSVDSEARKRWAYVKRGVRLTVNLAWLERNGYITIEEHTGAAIWTNKTSER